jgi:hypothetical protein
MGQMIHLRDKAHHTPIFSECKGCVKYSCGFSSAHILVFCKFMKPLRWNQASSVNHVTYNIPLVSPNPFATTIVLTSDMDEALTFWQLFDTWCKGCLFLAKVFITILLVM